jgi:hypothetical protein
MHVCIYKYSYIHSDLNELTVYVVQFICKFAAIVSLLCTQDSKHYLFTYGDYVTWNKVGRYP